MFNFFKKIDFEKSLVFQKSYFLFLKNVKKRNTKRRKTDKEKKNDMAGPAIPTLGCAAPGPR
jgi:hypothetical protein